MILRKAIPAAVIFPQSLQLCSIEIFAVENHGSDAPRIANVFKGIRIEKHKVCELSRFHGAAVDPKKPRRISRRRL